MKQMDVIPRGFQRKIHTIAVWDNNDFAEDTLSGHGTTHNTNGVLIQRSVDVCTTEEPIRLRKTKERSVSAPLVEIVPFLGKRKQNPSLVDSSLLEPSPEIQQLYLALDVAFCLCKIPEVSRNLFPGWTGFNTLLQEKDVPTVSRIGYLPVIDASPPQMSTVHTILLRSVEIADSLHVNNLVVVFDQAIYCKAQEIRWQSDLFKERLVIRLGDFHTTMTFLACVGKRFQETGLEDILIDAEEVAAGSVKGVLNGHHYNRSMRTHKLMFEALQRLRWAAFMEDLGLDERAVATDVVNDMHEAGLSPALCTLLKEPRVMDILDKYQSFIDRERAARPLFDYWSSYLDMVSILLLYVRATREGNWPLHLSATKTMVCWMFAYDRVNYARYLPAYIAEIENLPTTHPTVHESFMTGDFVVQRQSNYGFSQVACDMAIEQTINRDSKTKGGMTGLTQNKTSVNRWILSHHERADIAKACQTMCGTSDNSRMKRDLDQSSMKREENAVVALTNTIESMTDPFTYRGEHLLNISSGLVVSDDIESDLLQAHRIGKEAFEAFCKERILTGTASSIDQPIRTKKLKTFASSRKKSLVTKLKSETVTLKCNSALFSRLLTVGKTRNINLRQLLAHSLNPIPASLGTNEGLNVKTNKAALMHAMEADVPDSRMENVPASSALVIDGMAMLQALVIIPLTFGALADSILLQVIRLAKKFGCTRVDFVVDRYPLISIKSCEHIRRAASGSQVVNITRADQKTPKQFKKFLSAGKNKESLVEFLFAEWSRSALPEPNLKIIVCHGMYCHEIQRLDSGVRVTVIDELRCDHDEADTRLLLHAKHASTTHNDIMIKSPDTDVFILAVAASHQIDARLLFMTGTGAHSRIVDVNMVSAWYGQHTSRAILGLHVFTGCDSVSAFRGKGKLKAFRLFLQSPTAIQVFKQLGIDWIPSLDILSGLEEFVCALYNQPSFTDVNEARYKLFTLKHRIDETIPPNRDCLRQHSLRAGYQCAVHRRCLDSSINAPSPVDHGWKMENGNLEIQWMCDPPAPPSVLQEVHCKCSNSKCQRGNCSCVKAGLVCTDMCRCNDCFNSQEVGATPDYFADSGDDESEDDL